jgi:uncharacterized protein
VLVVPSRFTVCVPRSGRDEVFLLNTLTDAQALVSRELHAACFDPQPVAPAGPDRPDELDDARETLAGLGFLVPSASDDDQALAAHFASVQAISDEVRVTVLTTMRCNFSCGYCVQGDHDGSAAHMTLETADRVGAWVASRLDEVRPERLVVTFFGGEPLLNLPALERVAAHAHAAATARGVEPVLSIVTNGLLLTRALVSRLVPLGLRSVKVTLDGDQESHDRLRPLRGGQGTFETIVGNLRDIAGLCAISIGGNIDAGAADRCQALLDQLAAEPFAPSLANVSFKPVIRRSGGAPRVIPLIDAEDGRRTCSEPRPTPCDSCGFADDRWAWLREETRRRGLPAPDGVHMGPCEIHRRHAHTIGPDGRLFACPGYGGSDEHAVGHVDRPPSGEERAMAARRDRLAAWRSCGDCAFVPVCAGGCSVAARHEQLDMEAPACHKPAFEAAVVALARARVEETTQ